MNIPKYPYDYYELTSKVKLSDCDIDKLVNNAIVTMNEHPNWSNYSLSQGNLLIIIDRVNEDDGYIYEISVCKDHSRGFVKG